MLAIRPISLNIRSATNLNCLVDGPQKPLIALVMSRPLASLFHKILGA